MSAMTSTSLKREKLRTYSEARRKGVQWLLQHLNDDGSIGDPREGFKFYRAPWTFMITGEVEAANAICDWIRRNMLTPDNSIERPYRNSALLVGVHLAM